MFIAVGEFAQQMAVAHEQFAKEVQAVIGSFKRKNNEFKFERYDFFIDFLPKFGFGCPFLEAVHF